MFFSFVVMISDHIELIDLCSIGMDEYHHTFLFLEEGLSHIQDLDVIKILHVFFILKDYFLRRFWTFRDSPRFEEKYLVLDKIIQKSNLRQESLDEIYVPFAFSGLLRLLLKILILLMNNLWNILDFPYLHLPKTLNFIIMMIITFFLSQFDWPFDILANCCLKEIIYLYNPLSKEDIDRLSIAKLRFLATFLEDITLWTDGRRFDLLQECDFLAQFVVGLIGLDGVGF